jgi:hypothetical protein
MLPKVPARPPLTTMPQRLRRPVKFWLASSARSACIDTMPRLTSFLFTALLTVAAARAADQPSALFNGRDFSGWEFIANTPADIAMACRYKPDGVVAVTGQPVGYIATTATHRNYRLHVEWRWPAQPGNGGVLLHIVSGPKDRQWPVSFQAQTKNKSVGDVLPMAGATFADPLTSAPGAATPLRAHTAPDSEKPAGEWNACDIVCRGDTIEITVNGVVQNKISGCSAQGGKIGFQLEGVGFELRNVWIGPLQAIGSSFQIRPGPDF